jgi:hypothetical protein
MPPDSNDYSAVLVMRGFAGLKADVVRTVAHLRADGQLATATEIGGAFDELTARLQLISAEIAELAHRAILEEEQRSRVRPDTGGDGGPRMEDFLGESAPLTEIPGTVVINDERVLEENVPWWWTNEEGYSGHIGRVVRGFFFDAGFTGPSRPDPSRFREHPLFMTGSDQLDTFGGGGGARGGVGGRMEIHNPIPRREFVLHGYEAAKTEWHRQVSDAKARFDARVRHASVLARQRPVVP